MAVRFGAAGCDRCVKDPHLLPFESFLPVYYHIRCEVTSSALC